MDGQRTMMPEAFLLQAQLEQPDLAGALAACLRAASAAGLSPVAEADAGAELDFGNERSALIFRRDAAWICRFEFVIGRRWGDELAARLNALAEVARGLFRNGHLQALALAREGGGANCIPDVPIAKMHRHIVMTTKSEIEQEYDHPDVFWNAWSEREDDGDRALLFRAMEATDNVSYLRAVLDDQAALARAAKPHRTRYGLPDVRPEERPIYAAGEPRLLPVGYEDDTRTVEYSCVVEPDEHIHVWEIHALWKQIHDKKLPDGRPLETVRVVFFDREMAEAEKRPLLDVGARVYYQSTADEIAEITQ